IQEDAVEQKASSAPAERLEEEMWKPVNHMDSAVTEQPASNADAMQAAHGQEASRWFMLKGMLGGAEAPEKTPDHAPASDVPVLEVFSLAGGVGKTSLVATLGRALSARGEHVLLVEATFLGSLQYFFGACDVRPGVVRTFRPPASSSDAPIRLATVDPDALLVESAVQGSLATDIQQWAQGASRVIVDVATGATAIARGMLQMSTVVLVPLIPDVHAIITASSIDAFFQRNGGAPGEHSEVYYLLNKFDPSLPLHLDVRAVLREKLGERMLPFALPRTPAISEALAEGMTIIDYAPDSPATEDFISLTKWLDDVLAPVDMNRRGMRWSER
ncbi:MAG: cellulose synthase operon protein YhjQ/BcsQ, partial [Terracidiphilus sp.]